MPGLNFSDATFGQLDCYKCSFHPETYTHKHTCLLWLRNTLGVTDVKFAGACESVRVTNDELNGWTERRPMADRRRSTAQQGAEQRSSRTGRAGREGGRAGGRATRDNNSQQRDATTEAHTAPNEGHKQGDRTRTGWTNGTDNRQSHNNQQQKRTRQQQHQHAP